MQSTPVVQEGTLYIGSGDGNIYALEAKTGRKLWDYTTGGAVNSAPTVYDETVYVGSNDHFIYALKIHAEQTLKLNVLLEILAVLVITSYLLVVHVLSKYIKLSRLSKWLRIREHQLTFLFASGSSTNCAKKDITHSRGASYSSF